MANIQIKPQAVLQNTNNLIQIIQNRSSKARNYISLFKEELDQEVKHDVDINRLLGHLKSNITILENNYNRIHKVTLQAVNNYINTEKEQIDRVKQLHNKGKLSVKNVNGSVLSLTANQEKTALQQSKIIDNNQMKTLGDVEYGTNYYTSTDTEYQQLKVQNVSSEAGKVNINIEQEKDAIMQQYKENATKTVSTAAQNFDLNGQELKRFQEQTVPTYTENSRTSNTLNSQKEEIDQLNDNIQPENIESKNIQHERTNVMDDQNIEFLTPNLNSKQKESIDAETLNNINEII